MFEIANLSQVDDQITRWEAYIYELTRQAARGLAVTIFKGAVERSAQYSGDFAANWKYQVGAPDPSFQENAITQKFRGWGGDLSKGPPEMQPRIMGDPEAVGYAFAANRGRDADFALGDTIFISNNAVHDEPYAWKIEANRIKFRDGNEGEPIRRTLDEERVGGMIDAQQAARLRKARI